MANVRLLIEATNASSISSLLVGISSVLAMGDVRLDGIVAGEVNILETYLAPYLQHVSWYGE